MGQGNVANCVIEWRRFQQNDAQLAYAFLMRYVLGFDGGGTKTECVLMDQDRRVLSRGRGGPSNPNRVGFGGALASVSDAARLAVASAGIALRMLPGKTLRPRKVTGRRPDTVSLSNHEQNA